MARYLFYTLFLSINISYAQSTLACEIGVVFGTSMMKSDYGERNNSSTNFGNTGFGVGIVNYINFSANSRSATYFNEHFKIRSEASFNKTKLNHFGKWVEGNNSIGKQQLRAMQGDVSIVTLGMQLEYSPLSEIYEYERYTGSFLPYVSFGFQYNFYNVKATSTMGELGSTAATFPKYLVPSDGHPYGFSNEKNGVWSVTSAIGTRYKISELSDILIETRIQYFNSDWVDGLNPNKEIYTENKYNDWQASISLGYVFYLR